ncbi:MAG: hypothetical protein KDA88_18405 [Planctomycetaceae bacterium]|nr:hypothetical protein [Planctomycetaceae bacterium]MCB9952657.1 hypothetical protein [Planctomycetaceae bacterium]
MIFNTPRDVLSFVRECLEDADVDRLYGAVMEPTDELWRERIFEALRQIEASDTLEEVFLAEKCFPKTETEYKLGGHSQRTRHIHFDLIRVRRRWRLKKIWMCR